jgi:hypothetical protein
LPDYFPDPEALSRNGWGGAKKMLLPEQEHSFFVEEPEM